MRLIAAFCNHFGRHSVENMIAFFVCLFQLLYCAGIAVGGVLVVALTRNGSWLPCLFSSLPFWQMYRFYFTLLMNLLRTFVLRCYDLTISEQVAVMFTIFFVTALSTLGFLRFLLACYGSCTYRIGIPSIYWSLWVPVAGLRCVCCKRLF